MVNENRDENITIFCLLRLRVGFVFEIVYLFAWFQILVIGIDDDDDDDDYC